MLLKPKFFLTTYFLAYKNLEIADIIMLVLKVLQI